MKLSLSLTSKLWARRWCARFTLLLMVVMVTTALAVPTEPLCQIGDCTFVIPVKHHTIEQFLTKSILYTPIDEVREGLPWFGTARDDWKTGARVRKHMGLDLYGDSLVVVAAFDGFVTAVGRGHQWGGSITIQHADSLETMYLHITRWTTSIGARVRAGDPIGLITTAEGNAVQPQLHWAIKKRGKFLDPTPFIRFQFLKNPVVQSQFLEFDRTRAQREQSRLTKLKSQLPPAH